MSIFEINRDQKQAVVETLNQSTKTYEIHSTEWFTNKYWIVNDNIN